MPDTNETLQEKILSAEREQSHRILAEYGPHLQEHLLSGHIQAGIDHGFARQFLSDKRADQLGESFGISFVISRRLLQLMMLLEPLIILVLITLSVLSFGWWGLLSIIVFSILVPLSWRSAQLPRLKGRLPKALLFLFLGYAAVSATNQSPVSHVLIGVLGFLLFSLAIFRYSFPTWQIRRLLIENPGFASTLVDTNVVTFYSADQIARWNASERE